MAREACGSSSTSSALWRGSIRARRTILDTYRVLAGSYNPAFSNGIGWVSHAEGSET